MPAPGLTVLDSELDRLDDLLRPWVRRVGEVAEGTVGVPRQAALAGLA